MSRTTPSLRERAKIVCTAFLQIGGRRFGRRLVQLGKRAEYAPTKSCVRSIREIKIVAAAAGADRSTRQSTITIDPGLSAFRAKPDRRASRSPSRHPGGSQPPSVRLGAIDPGFGAMYRMGMGLRFPRSFKMFRGLRASVSRSGRRRYSGPRGGGVTIGRKGVRGAVEIQGTASSDIDGFPWARPDPPHAAPVVPGMEVTELTQVEIDVQPALESDVERASIAVDIDDNVAHADPLLMRIAVAIAALIAVVAIGWALLA